MSRKFVFLLVLLTAATAALGQEHYRVAHIQAKGSKRFAEADIVRASGLKAGMQGSNSDFAKAANQLGSCGAFSEVSYAYKPAAGGQGVDLEFDVTDAKNFLPVIFENLLWFQPEELQATVRSSVPLYDGSVPAGGTMADDIAFALTRLLNSRNLPSPVSFSLHSRLGGQPDAILFKADNASFKVGQFNFLGNTRVEPKILQSCLQSYVGGDYLFTLVQDFTKLNLLQVYHQRGFLKSEIGTVKPRMDGNTINVDVPITEGEQYQLAAFQWSGNTLISSNELSKHLADRVGEPVNGVRLEEEIEEIRRMFGKYGRLAARIKPVVAFDGDSASYTFEVTEGDLYRMGKLEVLAPEPQRQRALSAWKLKEGSDYDSTYLKDFFMQLMPRPGEPRLKWSVNENIDSSTKAVNVRLEARSN